MSHNGTATPAFVACTGGFSVRVFVILCGDTKKPDSDEVKGFKLNMIDARTYCEQMNETESNGSRAYYFEPADLIK